MSGWTCYILNGEAEPVGVLPLEHAAWKAEHFGECIIGRTTIGDSLVSTVFLGIGPQIPGRPPALWETLIQGGPQGGWQERYSSREDAVAGHAACVAALEDGRELD